MSIINDALKKAQQEPRKAEAAAHSVARNLEVEIQRRKPAFNWGPIFVMLVLVLITAPIVAPVFSSPFKQGNPHLAAVNQRTSSQLNVAPEPTQVASLPSDSAEAPATRQAQFGIEEAPMPTPYARPSFNLSGIIYSPNDSYCLINEKVVRVGETVQGAKLTKVTPDEVTLEFHGETIVIPVQTA